MARVPRFRLRVLDQLELVVEERVGDAWESHHVLEQSDTGLRPLLLGAALAGAGGAETSEEDKADSDLVRHYRDRLNAKLPEGVEIEKTNKGRRPGRPLTLKGNISVDVVELLACVEVEDGPIAINERQLDLTCRGWGIQKNDLPHFVRPLLHELRRQADVKNRRRLDARGVLAQFFADWLQGGNEARLIALSREPAKDQHLIAATPPVHEWAISKVNGWLEQDDPYEALFVITGAPDSGKSELCAYVEPMIDARRDEGFGPPLRYTCDQRSTPRDVLAAARALFGDASTHPLDQDLIDLLESLQRRHEKLVLIFDGPEVAVRQEPARRRPMEDFIIELVYAIRARESLWHVRVVCATADALFAEGVSNVATTADLSQGSQAETAVRRFVYDHFARRRKHYERQKVERVAAGVGADLGFAADLCQLALKDMDAAVDAVEDGADEWYARQASELAITVERVPGVRDVFAVLAAVADNGIPRTLLQSCTGVDESGLVTIERDFPGLVRRMRSDGWDVVYVIGRPFLREALRRLTRGRGNALLARYMLDRWSSARMLEDLLVVHGVGYAVGAVKERRPELLGRENDLVELVTDSEWIALRWKADNGRGFAIDLAEVAAAVERGEIRVVDCALRRRVEQISEIAPRACTWAEPGALDGTPWAAMTGAAISVSAARYAGLIAEAKRHAQAEAGESDLALLETPDVTRPPELRWSVTGSGRPVSRLLSVGPARAGALAFQRGIGEWSVLRLSAGVERPLLLPETESQSEVTVVFALSAHAALVVGTSDGGLYYYDVASAKWSERYDFHRGGLIAAACCSPGTAITTSVSQNVVVGCDWSKLRNPKIFEADFEAAGRIRSLIPLAGNRFALLTDSSLQILGRSPIPPIRDREFEGAEVSTLAFDRYSARLFLATGTDDVRVWDAETLHELAPLAGHSGVVTSAAVLRGGYLATGAKDRTVRLWETPTGREAACFRLHAGEISAVAAGSRDGVSFVAAVDRAGLLSLISVERLATNGAAGAGTVLRAHRGEVGAISVLPSGDIVTSARESFQLRAWWLHERGPSARPPQVARVRSLVFAEPRRLRTLTRRGVYKLGKRTFSGPFPLDLPLAATEDGFEGSGSAYLAGNRVAVGLSGGIVAVVDVERARVLDHIQIEPVAQAISSIARVSADTAVVGTSRGLVLLATFDANRRRIVVEPPLAEASWPVDIVCSLAMRRLAYATREDRGRPFVRVIEADGAPVAAASLVRDDVPLVPVALADGRDGRLLWATRSGLLCRAPVDSLDDPTTWVCWRAHRGPVTAVVALSGRRVLSFSDTDVVLSDPAEGTVVGRLDAAGRVHALARLPNPRGPAGAQRFDWWRLAVGQTVDAVTIWQLATSPG